MADKEYTNTPTDNTMAHDMEQAEEPKLKEKKQRERRGAYIRACFAKYYEDSSQFHAARAAMDKITKQRKLEQCIKAKLKCRQKTKSIFKKQQVSCLVKDVGSKLCRQKISKHRGTDYHQKLKEHVEKLKKSRMSKKTEQSLRCHHRYFNELMAKLNQSCTPTVEKALQLIADMQINEYSTRYITRAVYSLQQHPRADIHVWFLTRNKKVRIAIENLKGAQVITEDTRIPIVPSMVREFAEIADRDFEPKLAITMKAILWIGTTCMLRKGEMAGTMAQPACITCQSFQLHKDKTGMTITFHSWKMKSFRCSIPYNFVEGTEKQAYEDIRNYATTTTQQPPREQCFLWTTERNQ